MKNLFNKIFYIIFENRNCGFQIVPNSFKNIITFENKILTMKNGKKYKLRQL